VFLMSVVVSPPPAPLLNPLLPRPGQLSKQPCLAFHLKISVPPVRGGVLSNHPSPDTECPHRCTTNSRESALSHQSEMGPSECSLNLLLDLETQGSVFIPDLVKAFCLLSSLETSKDTSVQLLLAEARAHIYGFQEVQNSFNQVGRTYRCPFLFAGHPHIPHRTPLSKSSNR
jgi:hypothetical protein